MANVNMANFLTDLAKWARQHDLPVESFSNYADKSVMTDYTHAGRIYNEVIDFLNQSQMYGAEQMSNVFSLDRDQMNNMMPSQNHSYSATIDDMAALAEKCGTPKAQMTGTIAAMQRVISQCTNRTALQDHWMNGSESMTGKIGTMSDFYPASALADMQVGNIMPGQEAFGATVDTVIPDLRMALTVVLLKPHKRVMSRLIQRRTLAGAVITYVINRNELYDLQKSQDKDSYTRNNYGHRHNLVDLYRRPDPTDMSLTLIEPLKDNDDKDVLVEDGVIRFGTNLNLFDLVLDQTKAYRNRFNYTDLVSEGVMIDTIYLTITNNDGISEKFAVSVTEHPRARLMHLQTSDQFSGDRETTLKLAVPFHMGSKTDTGAVSKIFATVDSKKEYIQVKISAHVYCDIITSDVNSMVTSEVVAVSSQKKKNAEGLFTEEKEPVTGTLQGIADTLTVVVDGFKLDARFSEENLRQIDRAARALTYTVSYEMPQGKTIIVDFSMQQTMPEHVLNIAQELQANGIDHRNTQMFMKTMRDVHDRCVVERNDVNFMENVNGKDINRQYISGQQVNPEIFMGSIDLGQVASIRDSDMTGDIRQHVDSYLTKVLSIIHYRSQYLTQLDNNKVPTYKILTSSTILENLLALPHIHEHLMPQGMNTPERLYKDKSPNEPIEYTRTLMSGVKLEVITSAFYYLEDQMVVIPYIDGDPSNVLNFAHNWDLGQFVANYTPVDNNQVNRRVFMNTREWPIITCPIGAIIKVKNWKSKFPDITGLSTSN